MPLSLLVLGVLAAPASAATVRVDPSNQRLTYEAAANETNRLAVTREGSTFRFVDTGTTTTAQTRADLAGAGFACVRPASNQIDCTVTGTWDIRVKLGDMNDTVTLSTGDADTRAEGAVGNDRLIGGPGKDELRGDEGNDELTGGDGADAIRGGAGSDRIFARDGLRDEVGCDNDHDQVDADVEDVVDTDCELVDRPIVPPVVSEPAPEPPGRPEHPGRPAEPGKSESAPRATPAPVVAPAPLADDDVAPVEHVQPQAGRTVAAGVKRGNVLVKGTGDETFAPLDAASAVPVGATVDARAGVVRLTSATDLKGATQTAEFTGGVFKVGQKRGRQMTTVLTLTGALDCAAPGKARAAAAKRKTRRLWGSGHGRFTTRGRNSQATVRGTIWSVEDRCDGTLTRVERGLVAVDDFGSGKRTLVRAGGRHLARKRTKHVR